MDEAISRDLDDEDAMDSVNQASNLFESINLFEANPEGNDLRRMSVLNIYCIIYCIEYYVKLLVVNLGNCGIPQLLLP